MGYGPACGQGPCARRAHSSNPRCARRAHRYGDYVDLSLVVVPPRCALDDGRQHVEREECEGTAGSTVTSGRTMASRGRHDHALPSHTPYYRSRGTAARPLGERARRALETPWYPGGALPGANPPVRSRGLVCKVTRARELRPARSRAWRRHQRRCSGPAPALHAPRRPPGPLLDPGRGPLHLLLVHTTRRRGARDVRLLGGAGGTAAGGSQVPVTISGPGPRAEVH